MIKWYIFIAVAVIGLSWLALYSSDKTKTIMQTTKKETVFSGCVKEVTIEDAKLEYNLVVCHPVRNPVYETNFLFTGEDIARLASYNVPWEYLCTDEEDFNSRIDMKYLLKKQEYIEYDMDGYFIKYNLK